VNKFLDSSIYLFEVNVDLAQLALIFFESLFDVIHLALLSRLALPHSLELDLKAFDCGLGICLIGKTTEGSLFGLELLQVVVLPLL